MNWTALVSARRLALIVLAALTAWSTSAFGFDVYRDETGRVLTFPQRSVAVYVRPTGLPAGVTAPGLLAAVEAALETWAKVPGTQSPLVLAGLSAEATGFDVDIAFESKYKVVGGEVLAKTRRWADADGHLVRAEIRLNARDVQWAKSAAGSSTQVTADLQGILTHHLGHALGLDHSRRADATMYFYGTSATLRTLSVDDQRGLRWLWPASGEHPHDGGQCDACDSDADCSGGSCLAWPDGRRSCAPDCTGSDDCALGYSCGHYANGQACLPNDGACQPDSAKSGLGGPCASDLACGAGYCMPASPTGFCTATCDICNAPGQCFDTSVGPLCLVRGNAALGQPCFVPGDCQSFQCAATMEGGGRCTRSCSQGCPSSWHCGIDSQCVPDASPGTLPIGWPCRSAFDCQTGICLATPGGRFEKTCTINCAVASACPVGTGCTAISDQNWCLPSALAPATEGLPCPASGQCGAGLVCDDGLLPDLPACHRACAPFAAESGCASGQICVFKGGSPAIGACREPVADRRGVGAPCTAYEACSDDLVCVAVTAASGTCRSDCDPKSSTCSSSEICVALAAGGRGACVPAGSVTSADPLPEVAPIKDKLPNTAARTLNLPAVVKASAWKPKEKAAEPASGCQTGAPTNHTAALGLLAAALVVARRRRG
ncbi:MAG: matrixin family metalloprotease [Deltaproteobacteria bacterium]|nr:matrixin family metalloprotease [Deltaproteobacteria bacterium]